MKMNRTVVVGLCLWLCACGGSGSSSIPGPRSVSTPTPEKIVRITSYRQYVLDAVYEPDSFIVDGQLVLPDDLSEIIQMSTLAISASYDYDSLGAPAGFELAFFNLQTKEVDSKILLDASHVIDGSALVSRDYVFAEYGAPNFDQIWWRQSSQEAFVENRLSSKVETGEWFDDDGSLVGQEETQYQYRYEFGDDGALLQFATENDEPEYLREESVYDADTGVYSSTTYDSDGAEDERTQIRYSETKIPLRVNSTMPFFSPYETVEYVHLNADHSVWTVLSVSRDEDNIAKIDYLRIEEYEEASCHDAFVFRDPSQGNFYLYHCFVAPR